MRLSILSAFWAMQSWPHAEWGLGAGFYLDEIAQFAFAPIAVEGASDCGAGGGHVDDLFLSGIAF